MQVVCQVISLYSRNAIVTQQTSNRRTKTYILRKTIEGYLDSCDNIIFDKIIFKQSIFVSERTNNMQFKPRSHEGLRPCCDLCKTSHVVKSQVDLIRARDRS